jgi:phage terminase large subunit-like protein
MKADAALYRIKQVRCDMTRFEGYRQLWERERIAEIVDVRQTSNALSPPLRMIERLFHEGKLRQPDNPLSLYCLNNCRPKERNGKLTVEKSGDYNKIDFVDSLAFAFSYFCEPMDAKLNPPPGQNWVSVWQP